MAVDESYQTYVLDLLEQAGLRLTARPMFGGAGLFRGAGIMGVIVSNELYLRLPTSPTGDKGLKRFGRNYLFVPPDVLEDQERLSIWTKHLSGQPG